MKQQLERYWIYLAIVLAVVLAFYANDAALAGGRPSDAGIWSGQAGPVFEKGKTGINTGFNQTRNIVYGVGGIGAIGLGALAFFGRFQWAWFWALIGGLSLIALVDLGITTLTGTDISTAAP
jgi:hypothetical protein